MIRVILADDHTILRDKIRELLAQEDDLEIVGQASNGSLLLELLAETPADVVVLDMHMPMMNGIAATRIIRQQFPDVKVLVFSMLDHEYYVVQAMEAGALGYISKDASLLEIIHAIRTVSRNAPFMCTAIGLRLVDKFACGSSNTAAHTVQIALDSERETKQLKPEGLERFLASRRLEKAHERSRNTR